MKTYKVVVPVTVISRTRSRRFERDEEHVTEAEIEALIEHFRKCFTEETAALAPAPTE